MVWVSMCLDLLFGENYRDGSLYLALIEIVIITNSFKTRMLESLLMWHLTFPIKKNHIKQHFKREVFTSVEQLERSYSSNLEHWNLFSCFFTHCQTTVVTSFLYKLLKVLYSPKTQHTNILRCQFLETIG